MREKKGGGGGGEREMEKGGRERPRERERETADKEREGEGEGEGWLQNRCQHKNSSRMCQFTYVSLLLIRGGRHLEKKRSKMTPLRFSDPTVHVCVSFQITHVCFSFQITFSFVYNPPVLHNTLTQHTRHRFALACTTANFSSIISLFATTTTDF